MFDCLLYNYTGSDPRKGSLIISQIEAIDIYYITITYIYHIYICYIQFKVTFLILATKMIHQHFISKVDKIMIKVVVIKFLLTHVYSRRRFKIVQ